MTARSLWDCFLNVFRLRSIHSRLFGCKNPLILTSSSPSQNQEPKSKQRPSKASGFRAAFRLLYPDIERPISSLHTAIFPATHANGLNLIVQRSLTWSRPLSVIERELLKRSVLLPSVIRPLKQAIDKTTVKPVEPPTALITRQISTGEIEATGPREFVDALDSLQCSINERINDLKRLAKRLYNLDASVSLAYADGKASICASSESEMNNVVLPLIKEALPWNDCFNMNLLVSTQEPAPFAVAPIYLQPETSTIQSCSSFQTCHSAFSYFAEPSFKDILPDARPDELEVFSAWSDS